MLKANKMEMDVIRKESKGEFSMIVQDDTVTMTDSLEWFESKVPQPAVSYALDLTDSRGEYQAGSGKNGTLQARQKALKWNIGPVKTKEQTAHSVRMAHLFNASVSDQYFFVVSLSS